MVNSKNFELHELKTVIKKLKKGKGKKYWSEKYLHTEFSMSSVHLRMFWKLNQQIF